MQGNLPEVLSGGRTIWGKLNMYCIVFFAEHNPKTEPYPMHWIQFRPDVSSSLGSGFSRNYIEPSRKNF